VAVNVKKVAKDVFHDDEDVRILALTAVVQLSPASIPDGDDLALLIKTLERATHETEGDVLFLARKGLNHLRTMQRTPTGASSAAVAAAPRPVPSRERLLKTIEQHDSDTQLATAVSELVRVGTPDDVDRVVPLLCHRDPRVRSNAVEFMERHAEPAALLEHCVPLLQDDNNRVKGTVATVLGRLGHPTVAAYLERLLDDHRISVRESAVYALSNIRGAAYVDLLLKALRDPFEGIRLRAVQGLGRQKDPRTLPFLKDLLNDLDIAICEEAERAIAFITMEEAAGFGEGMLDLGGALADPPGVADAGVPTETVVTDPALRRELQEVGRLLFEYQQAGTVADADVDRICYEVVRYREFLARHRQRATALSADGAASPLADIRADLGNPRAAEVAARVDLAARLADCHERLGKIAVELATAGRLELTGDSRLVERVHTLRSKLER